MCIDNENINYIILKLMDWILTGLNQISTSIKFAYNSGRKNILT